MMRPKVNRKWPWLRNRQWCTKRWSRHRLLKHHRSLRHSLLPTSRLRPGQSKMPAKLLLLQVKRAKREALRSLLGLRLLGRWKMQRRLRSMTCLNSLMNLITRNTWKTTKCARPSLSLRTESTSWPRHPTGRNRSLRNGTMPTSKRRKMPSSGDNRESLLAQTTLEVKSLIVSKKNQSYRVISVVNKSVSLCL